MAKSFPVKGSLVVFPVGTRQVSFRRKYNTYPINPWEERKGTEVDVASFSNQLIKRKKRGLSKNRMKQEGRGQVRCTVLSRCHSWYEPVYKKKIKGTEQHQKEKRKAWLGEWLRDPTC